MAKKKKEFFNMTKILANLPTAEEMDELDKTTQEWRTNFEKAMDAEARLGTPMTPDEIKATLKDIADVEEYSKETRLVAEIVAMIKDEIEQPDSPYKDVPITNIPRGILLDIIKSAQNRHNKAVDIPAVKYVHNDTLEMGLDKISTIFFALNAPPPTEINGQFSLASLLETNPDGVYDVGYEKPGETPITLQYAYTFDDDVMQKLGLARKMTDYDFFVLTIFDDLRENGNTIVSLTQAYKALTGKRPAQKQLTKFAESVYKMMSTTFLVNDKEVMEAWGIINPEQGKTYKEIASPVLPVQIVSEKFTANNKIVESAIKILAPSPVLQVGKKIGQFTTIPKALLINDIQKTDRYYALMRYLLSRISRMKHDRKAGNPTNPKILYQTIYEKTGQTTARSQQLTNNTLFQILDHFTACKWIDGYTKDSQSRTGGEGIIIYLPRSELTNNQSELLVNP